MFIQRKKILALIQLVSAAVFAGAGLYVAYCAAGTDESAINNKPQTLKAAMFTEFPDRMEDVKKSLEDQKKIEVDAKNIHEGVKGRVESFDSVSPDPNLAEFEATVNNVVAQTAAAERERLRQERLARAERKKAARQFKFFKYSKDGTVAYSDRQPKKADYQVILYTSCYACSPLSTVDWRATRLYMTQFSHSIAVAANSNGLDPALVRAVIHAESNFNPLARSRKGAMGLMQLMPKTAKAMGVSDGYNSTQNIEGGAKYLALMLERFGGNITLAAAAYNAGPTAVMKYNGVPPYEETKTYVERVKILYKRYKSELALARN